MGGKYARELGYDRLYDCVAVADAEDAPHTIRPSIRNLRTDRLESPLGVLLDPRDRCRAQFEPARWAAFKADVGHFRQKLGRRWASVVTDHGYNGTPAWALAGKLLASTGPASDAQILALCLIDPLLLLAATALVWRAFGWRVLAVALLVFATFFPSRFYWTGGSFLRWDWVFCTTAVVCLLRLGRPWLAGAAMGYAALLRLFPAVMLAGPVFALATTFVRDRQLDRRMLAVLGGAALSALVILPASTAVVGRLDAWPACLKNITMHHGETSTNRVGLGTILSFRRSEVGRLMRDNRAIDPWQAWREAKREAHARVRIVHVAMILGALVLLALAVRRAPVWASPALALLLVPFATDASSYYYMFVLVVALLYAERPEVGIAALVMTATTQLVDWAPTAGFTHLPSSCPPGWTSSTS